MASRDKFMTFNTLACVAQGVIGLYTTVDLRNDSYVSGRIDQVDGFMNITVSDAVYTDACGNEYFYELFFVKERNVRYVHIPSEVNIKDTLEKKLAPPRKQLMPAKMSLKRKNLLLRQQETLERVQQIKKERLKKKMEKEASQSGS